MDDTLATLRIKQAFFKKKMDDTLKLAVNLGFNAISKRNLQDNCCNNRQMKQKGSKSYQSGADGT